MRIASWLLTALGCLAITTALAAIKYSQIQSAMAMAAAFPPPADTVNAISVGKTAWTPVRKLTGTVRAPMFIRIASDASGRVVNLPFAAGARVEQDAVILQLFDKDLQASRAALDADLALTALQLKRVEELRQDALASQDQLDTLRAQLESLRAQKRAVDAQITRLTVRAPFTGRLGVYQQAVGDVMQFGEILTTLTGIGGDRWIDFKVPQGLAEIAVGDTVQLRSIDGADIGEATVIAVAAAYNSGIRAYDVRALISNAQLRHGELLQVEVAIGQRQAAIPVPNHAVRWDVDGSHVFALTAAPADHHTPFIAQRRQVSLLHEHNGIAVLAGDLRVGETIATAGAFKLADNASVVVVDTQPYNFSHPDK